MRVPVPPTWNTTGMPASSARAHTPNRSVWLGECRGGQPEATSRAAAPCASASSVAADGPRRVDQRDVQRRQQARVDRAELEHAAVVGPGGGVGEVGVGVLHVVQAPVVERVEDELAREPEEVEGAGAVLGDEGSRGGEVLARHDLGLLVGPVLGRGVPRPQRVEGRTRGHAAARPGRRSGAARSRPGSAGRAAGPGRPPRRGPAARSASP